jgi:FkbM family methyltransferase
VAPELLKHILRKPLTLAGLEVRRRRIPPAQGYHGRGSLSGLLHHAKDVGFSPATVEPLEEYRPFLKAVSSSVPSAQYVLAAASAEPGELVINVHPDLVGSSVYLEDESSNVNGVPRMVPVITLDSLANDRGAIPPFLLKIDVQGAELDVLSGGERLLRSAEYVLLEASFFEFFTGGPQFPKAKRWE